MLNILSAMLFKQKINIGIKDTFVIFSLLKIKYLN